MKKKDFAIQNTSLSIPKIDLPLFFNLSLDLLCIADLKGNFLKVNPAFTSTLGYTEKELLNQPYLEIIHPGDIDPTVNVLKDLAKGINTTYFENRYRKKSGEYCWLIWSAYIDKEKNLVYASAKEDTKRKEYQHQLEAAHKDITTILESITDGFVALDKKWIIKYWNKQAELILGKERTKALGKSIFELYPEEEGKVFHSWYQRAIQTGSTVHFEEKLEQLDRWLEVAAYPSKEGVSVYFRDIDVRKKKEKELEEINEMYRLLAKATAGAIIKGQEKERAEIGRELHDNINQLLTSAKLYLNVARTNEEMRLTMITQSEEIINNTMEEIRHLSKSLIAPTLHGQGLQQALEEMINFFSIESKFSIHLTCNHKANTLREEITLTLFRITQEALVNIVKHAGATNVWIDLTLRVNYVELEIKDDGKGFEPDKKRNGIGLFNMKNRIDLHNGTMVVRSSPGKGCTISVQIPLGESTPNLSMFLL